MGEGLMPPYWCPHCKKAVYGKMKRDRHHIDIVCAICGSPEIEGYRKQDKFNPSRR